MEFSKERIKTEGKRVRLLAETRIEDPNGEVQVMRHAGYGTLLTDGESFGLVYTDVQGADKSRIHLHGTGQRVRMERDGQAKGTLEFVPGMETRSVYHLEYGDIEIRIRTAGIVCGLDEREGRIELTYFSGMNEEAVNRTVYTCRWKS